MNERVIATLVLIPFALYSLWVVVAHGPLGFLTLARREPWAMQMFIDLGIYCVLGIVWMVSDARRRQVRVWPFVLVAILAGSLGPLAYLALRKDRRAS